MKFFNWMQNKFNGGQGNGKPNVAASTYHTKQEPRKEEFSDWPNGLLAIGTFGNTDLRENKESEDVPNTQSSSPDLTEFTPEEVGKLQKELTKLLSKKPSQTADLPLDRFLNCPSSLEVDRRISNTHCSESSYDKEEDIDRTIRVILGRCNKVCMEKNNKAIGKKSVAFLLKKMFVCSSGFSPAPSFRDTLPESRMEKVVKKNHFGALKCCTTDFVEQYNKLMHQKVIESYAFKKDAPSKQYSIIVSEENHGGKANGQERKRKG